MSTACDVARLSLGAYALGTLEPGEQLAVETHLASCPTCLAELAELESVVPLLASLSPDDVSPPVPSEGLFARIATAVESADSSGPARPRRSTRWLAAAAASVVLIAGAGTAAGIALSRSSVPTTTVASASAGGVQLDVKATDQSSGTRLELTVAGLPRQEHCHLVARAADGSEHDAGSWDATYDGEAHVTEATDVERSQLRSLTLYGDDGRQLVAVDLPS